MALRLAGPDAQPLLTSRFVRGWITVAIVVGGLLLAGLLLLIALVASSPLLFGGSVLVGVCLLALGSVTEGGWHGAGSAPSSGSLSRCLHWSAPQSPSTASG